MDIISIEKQIAKIKNYHSKKKIKTERTGHQLTDIIGLIEKDEINSEDHELF